MAPGPAPKLVGIAFMFRAISQLQGGWSPYEPIPQERCIAWKYINAWHQCNRDFQSAHSKHVPIMTDGRRHIDC